MEVQSLLLGRRQTDRPVAYRRGGLGGSTPRNFEVLTKLSRNSLKVPKIKKILLYEMKFLVPNYILPPEPLTRGLPPPRSPFCPLPSTEFVEPPRTKFLGTPLGQTDVSLHREHYFIFTSLTTRLNFRGWHIRMVSVAVF
jgi:hypothetical protein